jgi:protein-S-isoprenylcysteine O-methyltransferase Ste14
MLTLELKIPPPLVALLCATGMWAIAQTVDPYVIQPILKWAIVGIFILVGAAFDIAGLLEFRRHQTTINPLHPEKSSALVTGGVYQITRNPMYVGMACFLMAWTAYLENSAALLGVIAFMLFITYFQIKPEERMLTKIFGGTFVQYQQRVKRWL